MSNEILYIAVDKVAFEAEVQKYLDLSPVYKEWADVKALKWPDALVPPQLWVTVKELTEMVAVVTSAVEVAKAAVLKQADPDGSKGLKLDKQVALETAVRLLASSISFKGWLGTIVNWVWVPLLNLLVSVYVNQQPIGDWVSIALKILQIASVVA